MGQTEIQQTGHWFRSSHNNQPYKGSGPDWAITYLPSGLPISALTDKMPVNQLKETTDHNGCQIKWPMATIMP